LQKKFGKRITIIKKGLGETAGEKEFHLSEDSTLSSFSDTWINAVTNTSRFKDKKWLRTVRVSMTTADELIAKYGRPAFIKIDVEGYELEVLKGLSQAVGMISFEYTVPEQPERAIQCIAEIEKHNRLIECNYSIGEDLVWALPQWISREEMVRLIRSKEFQSTSFGDIYVRTSQNAQ
jgi:FkbM family methyltransferase